MYEYRREEVDDLLIGESRILLGYDHFPNFFGVIGETRAVNRRNLFPVQSDFYYITRKISILFSLVLLADNANDVQEHVFEAIHIFIGYINFAVGHEFKENIHFRPFADILTFIRCHSPKPPLSFVQLL